MHPEAPPTRDQVVVIVGAGLAGGNAAVTLREEGWPGRIVLLGAEPGIPFGRPPLSKTYLRGEEDLSAWEVKPSAWYGEHAVELRNGVTVRQVDTARKQLRLATGGKGDTLDYDKLILCTGATNRPLAAPGATLPGIFQLRTLAECEAIRQVAQPGARAVVVGMGFIGAEVAASLRQLGLEVTAVLSGAAPLANVLGAEVAAVLATIHREQGVRLVTQDHVIGFEGDQGPTATTGNTRVAHVLTAMGERLDCDLVVAGVGVMPAVDALAESGIALDNGILVDARCQTSVPDVFAAGDVANVLHPVFGRVRVEHFNNAEQQGRAAARAVLGARVAYDYIYSFWSDQYDHKIEYVGFAQRWARIVLRGSPASRRFLAFYLTQEGVLQAAFGLNRGGDPELEADAELRACQALIRDRIQFTDADMAALADERVDLWSLTAAR
jgi:3-phenylpropionate/trans-cinnamate dioxygenase ferredoxin reductase subunit